MHMTTQLPPCAICGTTAGESAGPGHPARYDAVRHGESRPVCRPCYDFARRTGYDVGEWAELAALRALSHQEKIAATLSRKAAEAPAKPAPKKTEPTDAESRRQSLGPCWLEILDAERADRNRRKPVTFPVDPAEVASPDDPNPSPRKPKLRATPTLAQRITCVGTPFKSPPGQGDHASPKWRTQTARGFRTRRTG